MKTKIFILYSYIPFVILFLLISGCTKKIIKDEPEVKTINSEETIKLLKIIEEINDKSPDSFSLNLDIDGILNNKKFKSTGKAVFNNNPRQMKVTFADAFFGSALTTIIQDGEIIKLYFPIEKILYMDNINTIKIRNYADINLDYYIIAELTVGRIPIIKDYFIKKALMKDENGQFNENDIYIILENNLYYETIAFQKDFPDKILIVNKNTREKTEIYLKNPFKKRDITFFKTIQLISTLPEYKITVEFSSIIFNKNIDLKKIFIIDLPKNCKIIYTE